MKEFSYDTIKTALATYSEDKNDPPTPTFPAFEVYHEKNRKGILFPLFKLKSISSFFKTVFDVDLNDYFPKQVLDILGNITITSEAAIIGGEDKHGLSLIKKEYGYQIDFAIQYDGEVHFDEAVKITNFYIAFTITQSSVEAVISSGKISFNSLALNLQLTAKIPSWIIMAEMSSMASSNDHKSIAAKYLGDFGKDISVENIRLLAAPRVKSYDLHLAVSNVLNLPKKLKVNLFQADISYRGGSGDSDFAVKVYTDLEIGFDDPLVISLSAAMEKSGSTRTWKFAGSQHHPVTVAQILKDLGSLFGAGGHDYQLPAFIANTTLNYLGLAFEISSGATSSSQDYTFTLGLGFPIGERVAKLEIYAHFAKNGNTYELELTGGLLFNGLQLGVGFARQKDATHSDTLLLGGLKADPPIVITSQALIRAVAPSLADKMPIAIEVQLEDLLFALHAADDKTVEQSDAKGSGGAKQSQKDFLFRLAFALLFDLSGFPLIGKMLHEVKFTDGQIVAANKDWSSEHLGKANQLLELIKPQAPAPIALSQKAGDTVGVAKGISLGGTLQISEELQFPLSLSFGGKQKQLPEGKASSPGSADSTTSGDTPPTTPDSTPAGTPAQANAKPDQRSQSKVDQVISAVRLQKVGLIFENGRLGLNLTGGLALAAFEFELMGLQVTVPMSVLSQPKDISQINFSLEGVAAKIQKGKLAITGAFMRMDHPDYEEYAGVVQVQLTKFSLAGVGSYAEFPKNPGPGQEKHTSLFLFVALGFSIPVHPSLLIEGMCLGFGIHRDALPPKMDEVLTYPLVQMSVTPPPDIEINKLLESVGRYFPPQPKQHFVVAGIKFRAFGIVKTLAMLIVKLGREFELNLIGVSSIEFPALFVELGWQARFVPSAGYLFLGGQLTPRSYLLIPEVQLTGGFAVAAWMGQAHHGDFVVSVGGYHPQFVVPKHYPDHIPRLGISFVLDPLVVKGGVYFAITPKCLMMGGFLEASVDKGWIKAFLKIHMDAIIFFEPFHYDLQIGVEVGVDATIGKGYLSYTLHLHLTVDVHLWGPEFSGTAAIDVGPKTFDLEFGAGSLPKALPLQWHEFEDKFLKSPDKDGKLIPNVCNISITKGLLRKVKDNNTEYHVIDPKQVALEAKSLIPLTEKYAQGLGITPMDVKGGGYTATMEITGADDFRKPTTIEDSVPSGIWGAQGLVSPDLGSSDSGLVQAVTGKGLVPKPDRESSETHELDKESLAVNVDEFELLDQAVAYQLKERSGISYAAPVDPFEAFTGLSSASLKRFDEKELLKSTVLSYDLV